MSTLCALCALCASFVIFVNIHCVVFLVRITFFASYIRFFSLVVVFDFILFLFFFFISFFFQYLFHCKYTWFYTLFSYFSFSHWSCLKFVLAFRFLSSLAVVGVVISFECVSYFIFNKNSTVRSCVHVRVCEWGSNGWNGMKKEMILEFGFAYFSE